MAPPEARPRQSIPFERLAVFAMPEWTHGDDDKEPANVSNRQRRRFRAAHERKSVDGVTRGRQRGTGSLKDRGLLEGVGAAAGAVAGGVGNGFKALASGQGLGEAAGNVAEGIGKGVGAAAGALIGAGKAAGEGLKDLIDGSSDNDSDKDKPKKEKPPPQTQAPPPPPPPPETTETIPETSITPKQPPPQDPQPPPQPPPQQPEQTSKPVDNIPPPKAEAPKPSSSASPEKPPDATSDENSSEATQTSTAGESAEISLSTLVPEATSISVSGSILSLTPVLTAPFPAITSGVRKGIDRQPPDTTPFAARPSTTLTTSISPSGGPFAEAPQRGNNNDDENGNGSGNSDDGNGGRAGLSPAGEKALISVFTIFGVFALLAIAFFFWRRRRTRKANTFAFGDGALTIPEQSALDKPKELARRMAAKVPILRNRFGDRGWVGLDEPYADSVSEKRSASPQHSAPSLSGPIMVQTSFTRSSVKVPPAAHADSKPLGGGLMPKPSISSTAPQINLTLPSTFGKDRLSDLSSLSSGFGDGDIIMPPQAAATVKPYQPSRLSAGTDTAEQQSRNRDTVYTEASEDTPPRFRTVNSWVRQQTGRVKREKQREEQTASENGTEPPVPSLPPEQEFKLMMPDGEEPRRVEDTDANIGMAH